jgi:hypothetical protein
MASGASPGRDAGKGPQGTSPASPYCGVPPEPGTATAPPPTRANADAGSAWVVAFSFVLLIALLFFAWQMVSFQ